MIPFLDMSRMHNALLSQFQDALQSIVVRSAFVNGQEVKDFEAAFATWTKSAHCLGFSSGLDAETIGLRALGLQPGDKVLAPAMTFIATIEAITHAGLEPVLVDVDEAGLIDLDQARAALRAVPGIKAILPVHLFGLLVNPQELLALAQEFDLRVFEDACQAHGAQMAGHMAGSIGDAAAFSFYPGKNLGALGDGGALTFKDPHVGDMARALREHGQTQKYHHKYEGYTARLDNLQAAFLSIKLPHLSAWTEQRIEAARIYQEELCGVPGVRLQSSDLSGRHVYHLFVLLTDKREQLAQAFRDECIGFGLHYPIPIHQLECYKGRDWISGVFPNAEHFAQCGISLPIFPGIQAGEIKKICQVVRRICE